MAGPARGARLLPVADVAFLLMGALFVAAAQANLGQAADTTANAAAALVQSAARVAAHDGAALNVLCCRALELPDASGARRCREVDVARGTVAALPLAPLVPASASPPTDRVVLLLFEAGSGWHEAAFAAGDLDRAYGGPGRLLVPWSLPAIDRARCEDVVGLLPGAGGAP